MTEPRESNLIQPDAVPAGKQNPTPVRRSLVLVGVIAAILIGAFIVVTSPGEPGPEAIRILTDRSLGTFTATGDAVDSGSMCPGGVFLDQRPSQGLGSGLPDGLSMESRFICADGSADFRIRGEVAETNPLLKQDEGHWTVMTHSGIGADFGGEGRFIAVKDSLGQRTVTVTYTGEVTPTQPRNTVIDGQLYES